MENRAKTERDWVLVILNLYIKPHTSASNFSFGLNQSDLGFLSFANKKRIHKLNTFSPVIDQFFFENYLHNVC